MTPLIIAAAVFLLTLWRPRWGVASSIVLWPSYLLRTTLAGVPTTALELSVYAVAAAVIIRSFFRPMTWRAALPRRTWAGLLGLWVIAWIVATVFSADKNASLGAFKAWVIDPLIFVALLRVVAREVRDMKFFAAAAVGSGVAVSLAGLVQMTWFPNTLQDGRLSSWFHPVANYAAMYLAPLAVVAWTLFIHRAERRWFWWVAAGLITVALGLTVSFGGLMSLGAGLVVAWLFLPGGKLKRWLAIGAIGAGIIVLLGLASTHYFAEHFQSGRSSGLVRQQIWVTTIHMIEAHPLTGIGPNNFEAVYRKTIPDLFWPPLEWGVAKAHNLYLNLWVETGILGLVSFLALVGMYFRSIPAIFSDPDRRAWAIASLAAIVAVLIHGLVDTPYFKNDLAMEFVSLIILPWLGLSITAVKEKQN